MRLIDTNSTFTRLSFLLAAVLMVTPLLIKTVHASMVIAPSTIVVKSTVEDSNYRNNSKNDVSVKAIINYLIEPDLVVINDASTITMTLYPYNSDDEVVIEAAAIRYCYTDDNLIIAFDREAIAGDILDAEMRGLAGVAVYGTFTVYDPETETYDEAREIDEFSEIHIYNPTTRE